jgi:ATP-dependent DNA helicase RecG
MHLIEHYGSGIRRIKDECAKNGNTPPTWSQNYGSFITVYKSRLESDPIKQDSGTTNEVVNGPHEVVNEVVSEADNKPDNKPDNNRTLDNIIVEVVRRSPGINRAGVAMSVGKGKSVVAEAVARLKALGLIEYRGSKKTGGYYAVKQED